MVLKSKKLSKSLNKGEIIMKEIYTKPKTEVEEFKTVDVITTSTQIDDRDPADNDVPWGQ